MKNTFFIPIIAAFFSFCCGESKVDPVVVIEPEDKLVDSTSAASDTKLLTAWSDIRKALQAGDTSAFKSLTTPCIRCSNCVTNTNEEQLLLERLKEKHPNTWYDQLTNSMNYLPVDRFIKEDFPLVFDSLLIAQLSNDEAVSFYKNDHNADLFQRNCFRGDDALDSPKLREVLIQLIKPYHQNDGVTVALDFIETKRTYLFCGYGTIP